MLIRNATIKDALRIKEIALLRKVSSCSNAVTGLIDYPVPSVEEYEQKIEQGIFYVAEEDEIVGFREAYLSKVLTEVLKNDPLVNRIKEWGEEPFIYGNITALLPIYEGKGIPALFLKRLCKEYQFKELWVAIVQKPFPNQKSIASVTKMGFSLEEKIDAFNLTFGVYKKVISSI